MRRLVATIALLLGLAAPLRAAEVPVAVAANFAEPAKAIAAAFRRATGDRVVIATGSSGAFATQIAHGAPFQLFLSADAARPAALERAGLTVAGSRFTYAVGRLVLYSTDGTLIDGTGMVLRAGRFRRLAIADPATAPYGTAAVQVLQRMGLAQRLRPRLVQGNSIAQAYEFVASGAAELGFVAEAQVVGVTGGSRWLVPNRLHDPIAQQAVLLKTGAANPAARAFLAYLRSPPAKAIIRHYGYAIR